MSAHLGGGGAKLRPPTKLPAAFGTFLFADVGAVGPDGMPLTVLSALARLGLDPWDEAGRLSKMRDPEAIGELARSLAAVPGASQPDSAGSAKRLVALLPGRAAPPSPPSTDAGLQASRRRDAMLAVAGVLTILALLLAGYATAAGSGIAAGKPPRAIAGQP